MVTVDVEIRVVGRRAAAVEPRPMAIDLPPGPTTLGRLIEVVVRSEVAAFRQRTVDRAMIQVLTDGALAVALSEGKVTPGEVEASRVVDEEAAVAAALLAHRDGLYEVVVDDQRVVSLDHEVKLAAGTALMFIRLVALHGG